MSIRKFVTGACGALLLSAAQADDRQVPQAAQLLDAWLAEQADYNDFPSLSVALVRGQQIVYAKSFGDADREQAVAATADTLYRIGSLSKLFTSIAVMQLRDAGKLTLRDPVSRHLSWFHVQQGAAWSDEITIEGLLSHSSGLPREASSYEYDWMGTGKVGWPTIEQLQDTRSLRTVFPAWQRSHYSNLGMMLAGQVVASASGTEYHDYVRRRVLEPLGLTNTFTDASRIAKGARLAVGYGVRPGKGRARPEVPAHETGAWAPAGGFVSSAQDLAKFAMWQIKLRRGGADPVLTAATLLEMQRPHGVPEDSENAFGLGFEIKAADGRTLIGHNGGVAGYQAHIRIDTDKDIGAVALINATGTDLKASHVVERMLDVLAAATAKSLAEEAAAAKAQQLQAYAGMYYHNPWDDEGTYVMPWGGGLASLSLRTDDPLQEMVQLTRTGADQFAPPEQGGEPETRTFMRGKHGAVVGFKSGQTVWRKHDGVATARQAPAKSAP